jgi:outer membrane receptor protein involved in Fe transport
MSKRKTLSSQYAEDFIVVNLTLYWANVLKNLNLSASIYNLFDEDYGDPGGAELRQKVALQDGRNFRIKATATFSF